ncbi:MAG: YceI family protein [Pseudomonadales bacterium]|jgi:polyisoprenoid-binding protein YceI|nr:YceI family protein [Pseudomonadales bacterium]
MRPNRDLISRSILLALVMAGGSAAADWRLVAEDSSLGFVSVKNARIAEGHQFTALSGSVDEEGAELVIELASVDTLIPIRDERMRELLFEVARFPTAIFRTAIDPASFEDLAVGESRRMDVSGELALHGERQPLTATLLVTRTASDRVSVASTRPVVISADAFALGGGVARLREVAGLDSITPMVPVSFALSFVAD